VEQRPESAVAAAIVIAIEDDWVGMDGNNLKNRKSNHFLSLLNNLI